jgi:tRNA pseudouridine38/39 synthase
VNKHWKKRTERAFDPAKYNTRLVAFKLAYLGKKFNGFENHAHVTPLPTIEEELWKAFNKARLIFPKDLKPLEPGAVNWEGTEYSKCGRTDKGVSAFGQVIGIRVRSNRPLAKKKETPKALDLADSGADEIFNTYPRVNVIETSSPPLDPSRVPFYEPPVDKVTLNINNSDVGDSLNFDPIADEIPYCALLNRLLPPEIRILAWCPSPPLDFSARFSCRERRYKYFFTNPCLPPVPRNLDSTTKLNPRGVKDGYLDIEAMKEAAKLFEGSHDFRNFCKVDPGKQITNFERVMFHASIQEESGIDPSIGFTASPDFAPKDGIKHSVYSFNLHGSAFLWHQVRCMVSILFLVGQGLEKPSIVSELLDATKNSGRPTYEMATDTPLILWDCIFPKEDDPERKDALDWVYIGNGRAQGDAKYGPAGLMENIWSLWREKKMDELLVGSLIKLVQGQGDPVQELEPGKKPSRSQRCFDGSNEPKMQGSYTPVMKKPKMEAVEVVNERFAIRKGFENSADMKIKGFRNPPSIKQEAVENAVDDAPEIPITRVIVD